MSSSWPTGAAGTVWLQVTVPFAYSIMHRSHPVEKSKLEKEFVDEFLGPEEVNRKNVSCWKRDLQKRSISSGHHTYSKYL